MTEKQKRELILTICDKYVGVTESPANSNNVIFNTRFYGREVRDGDKPGAKYPWCGTSVSEIFQEANLPLGVIDYRRGFAGCPYAISALKDPKKSWGEEVSFEDAQPGDIVFFDWDGNAVWDHVGILYSKSIPTCRLWVYEGNTSIPKSTDPKEMHKANSNGGAYMLRDDRKFIKNRVKFVRPNIYKS